MPPVIKKVDSVAVPGRTDGERINVGDSKVLRPGSIGGLKVHKPRDITSYMSLLVYGEPGIGKTLLGGSAVEVECLRPMLVINVEDGAKTLRGAYPDNEDIDIVTPRTFGTVQKIFDELRRKNGAGYKCVMFDNATEGQKIGIEYIFDQDKLSTDFTEFEEATWANHGWNRSSEQMRKMVRYFNTLPMHKIFLAWRKDFSKDMKVERWGPAFSNSLAKEIPGLFDSVFYYYWTMSTDEKTKKQVRTRVLLTGGTVNAVAKDRDGGHPLPLTIKDPTMEKLCNLWGMI